MFLTIIFVANTLKAQTFHANSNLLDLKGSLKWAEEHSPDFLKLKHSIKVAELEAETARKYWIPRLDLITTHGLFDRDPRLAYEPWNSSFDLTLSETIYDDGQSEAKKKLTQKQLELAEQTQKYELEKLTLALATQFLQYSLSTKNQQMQEVQLELIRKQFTTASRDYHQGLKTQRDYLRFKTQLSRSEIDVLAARNSVLKSKEELIRLIGGPEPEIHLEFLPLPLSEIDTRWNLGPTPIESHPRYLAYLLSIEVEDLRNDLAKKVLTPSLTFSAGSSYSSANYIGTNQRFQDNDFLSWNVLLTLKYNLFDGGERARNFRVALERSKINKNDLASQILSLKSELQQWALNFEQSQSNQKLAAELFSLERKNRNLIDVDYRNGRVSYLDLITSMRDYLDAQFKFSSAVYDSEILKMTYLSNKGTLHESLR